MIEYLLYVLFFVSCIVLIVTVLLQPGKTDAGALFTSGVSSTAFGPRGTQSVLSRITIGAAVVFMLSALLLAMPAITGNISVLQTTSGSNTATPAPAQADTITNLNSNIQVGGEGNTNTNTTAPGTTTNANSSNANQ